MVSIVWRSVSGWFSPDWPVAAAVAAVAAAAVPAVAAVAAEEAVAASSFKVFALSAAGAMSFASLGSYRASFSLQESFMASCMSLVCNVDLCAGVRQKPKYGMRASRAQVIAQTPSAAAKSITATNL